VVKSYAAGGAEFRLTIPRLEIPAGARLAFVGESGSGKSTLLELLAMILRPSASEAFRFRPHGTHGAEQDIAAAWQGDNADHLANLRSRHIGYVLQYGGLLPYLSVKENIELSRQLLKLPRESAARRWAERLNIMAQLDKNPAELSVGQRQRVAIARALAHEPSVLIADEPTASVDPMNAERIMALLVDLVEKTGVTLIVASHAHRLVERAGLRMIDHRIDADTPDSMYVTVDDVAG